jgi:hypothetical protein
MILKLMTRSQAAEYLHAIEQSKSIAQWYSFLNDNGRKDPTRGGTKRYSYKIPTTKDLHGTVLYSRSELEKYIKVLNESRAEKAAKLEKSRTEQITKAFGVKDTHNQNKFGQCFGYKWQGASVNIVTDNMEKDRYAAAIQLIINHPLRASALSLDEAKAFTQELIDSIARLDKDYAPQVTSYQKHTMRTLNL